MVPKKEGAFFLSSYSGRRSFFSFFLAEEQKGGGQTMVASFHVVVHIEKLSSFSFNPLVISQKKFYIFSL